MQHYKVEQKYNPRDSLMLVNAMALAIACAQAAKTVGRLAAV
jgi:hypothetical protein